VVRDFERELLSQFRTMLAAGMAGQVPAGEAEVAAETVLAAVLGAYASGLSKSRRTQMLRHLLERLTSS
jgi:hypothetical protein